MYARKPMRKTSKQENGAKTVSSTNDAETYTF